MKLKRGKLQIMLLYYVVPKKQIGNKRLAELRELYDKVKADNTPKKEYKEWTSADKAQLIKFMNKEVFIHKTELGRQRESKRMQDNQRLVAIAKEQGEAGVLEVIQGALLLVSMASSEDESVTSGPMLLFDLGALLAGGTHARPCVTFSPSVE